MPAPLVTVIVPGRDIADFAPAALDSLRAQTETSWRAILVDDGSRDDTGRIFEAATREDPRFTLLRHARSRGLGAARNAALDLVDTEYLGFLDGDDELTPTALERMTRTLAATGSDFVTGAYVRSRWDGRRYVAGRVQPWVAAATDPERLRTTIFAHPAASANIVAWSKVSRTAFWHDLRFPEGVAYEDQVVAQRMYTTARAFDVIPDVVVKWRLRENGTSITQGKHKVRVLHDYLAALRGGIDVLHRAGARDAVAARLELILAMDVPPLQEIAGTHPDPAYPAAVRAFLEELEALPEFADARVDPTLAAALRW
ncbi:MAG: glycosyl transferase [Microbacterium sp. 14-71-5]|uniref:glycosyltransferase family 2 protein n=1 Tax=Microbacterium sp. 13-71-7 TaxID=1970399 RepID=UPI000BC39F01|nr:glycosyltransferase family 2 protein [Microbacterium sp. 13-71-7]OZB79327.1 MAG: glycosyl transferase [Microbacterium sp. 14-71-5]OZB83429.1 MAG: glycosyl transferase [Microbacterium sp. 13-71-7]